MQRIKTKLFFRNLQIPCWDIRDAQRFVDNEGDDDVDDDGDDDDGANNHDVNIIVVNKLNFMNESNMVFQCFTLWNEKLDSQNLVMFTEVDVL